MNKYKEKILTVFKKHKLKFEIQKYRELRLTCYEKSAGFTEQNRMGSKYFCIQLGFFIEKIFCNTSFIEKYFGKYSIDGKSKNYYYQFKNRYDTMKQSLVCKEIEPMLIESIKENKGFILVILIDKNNISRDIPLHEGNGLSKIKNIKGYNPDKHRWKSDECFYEFLYPKYGKEIKKYILELLSTLKLS